MKKNKNILVMLMSIVVTLMAYTKLEIVDPKKLVASSSIARFFEKIFRSIDGFNAISIILLIGVYTIFKKWYFKSKFNKPSFVISVFMSIMNVVGYSFRKYNSTKAIFGDMFQFCKSCFFIFGYIIIFYILIKKLFEFFENYSNKDIKFKKFNKIYDFIFVKHPFIMPLLIIFICWLPYIIFYFPGCSTGTDTRNQIYMYYGIDSFLTKSVVPLKQGFYLNNLHPLLHSLYTGLFLDLGFKLFHSYTIGFFICNFIQVIIMLLILSYTIVWMKKMNIPNWVRVFSLIIYSFLSFFPYFAITHGKDTIFSLMMLLLVMKIYELIKNSDVIYNKKYFYSLMGIIFVLLFFRNDGIYRIVISFLFILLANKKIYKKLLIVTMVPITTYLVYLHILLPALYIPSGNIREMLSVPFQQTARVVYVHGYDAYSKEDIDTIKNVLTGYDQFKDLYRPSISDPIKNTYNMYSTKKELINYFKVWFKYLFKYPKDYIDSFINNTYGYFYLDYSNERGYGYTSLLQLDDDIFNITYIKRFKVFRDGINLANRTLRRLPVLYLLYSVGFYGLFCFITTGYFIYKKCKKYIIVLIPLYSVILINIVSPVNCHYRYTLPIIFSFPLLISIICNISNEESKS